VGLLLEKLPTSGVTGPWHLIFDEEFNGSSLNTNRWTPYWFSNGNVVNNVNCYSANVSVTPAHGLELLLAGANSGSVVSSNPSTNPVGFQFTYGYVESQITFPNNNDWSAGWILGNPYPSGEFDYAETDIPNELTVGNYHYGTGDGTAVNDPSPISGALGVSHVFGLDWQPNQANFYYDGTLHHSITGSIIVSTPQYLIFNHGATSSSDASGAGSKVTVRYVRVWQH
jgi:beta-glucanase (GH16 family)